MSQLVTLRIEERGDVVIAHLSGELDVAGASATGESISEAVPASARGLAVDFSALEFIDSSGVAMLFTLARRLGSRRQELHVVVPADSSVARVLEIVEFGRAAPMHQTLEAALAAMRRRGEIGA